MIERVFGKGRHGFACTARIALAGLIGLGAPVAARRPGREGACGHPHRLPRPGGRSRLCRGGVRRRRFPSAAAGALSGRRTGGARHAGDRACRGHCDQARQAGARARRGCGRSGPKNRRGRCRRHHRRPAGGGLSGGGQGAAARGTAGVQHPASSRRPAARSLRHRRLSRLSKHQHGNRCAGAVPGPQDLATRAGALWPPAGRQAAGRRVPGVRQEIRGQDRRHQEPSSSATIRGAATRPMWLS